MTRARSYTAVPEAASPCSRWRQLKSVSVHRSVNPLAPVSQSSYRIAQNRNAVAHIQSPLWAGSPIPAKSKSNEATEGVRTALASVLPRRSRTRRSPNQCCNSVSQGSSRRAVGSPGRNYVAEVVCGQCVTAFPSTPRMIGLGTPNRGPDSPSGGRNLASGPARNWRQTTRPV